MRRLLLIVIFSGLLFPATAQEDQFIERLTSLMVENENEQGTLDIREAIQDLLLNPVNLNTAGEQQLTECGLFTPYQVYGILKYREEMGSFFSIYELVTIPGFRRDFLEDISPLVTFIDKGVQESHRGINGILLSNVYRKFPASQAYLSSDSLAPRYPGSPYKLSSRFKLKAGERFVFGLAYEKDAGETFSAGWRPEHLAGYITYNPGKLLKHVTIGNYRIHTGMGLVHGLGFKSSGSGVQVNGFRTNFFKPFASTAEYNYYRGIVTEWNVKKWRCTAFWSYKPEDVSLAGTGDSAHSYSLLETIRETGLHRTESELKGRNLASRNAGGFSINRNHDHFNYGLSGAFARIIPTGELLDSVPLLSSASARSWNLSAYSIAYGDKFEAFSEFAINELLSTAILVGANIQLNPALSFYASFRRYAPKYTGQFPGAYASGSNISNETGLNTGFTLIPFNHARICLDNDVCYYPSRSYYLSVPGFANRSRAEFQYSFHNGPQVSIKYTFRQRQVDEERKGTGLKVTESKTKNQWRLHYSYPLTESLTLSGRLEWAGSGSKDDGFLVYQQVRTAVTDYLTLSYRLLLFDVESWDNRIYCYEPGVRYSFLFPSYYGKGIRNTLVLSSRLSRWLTLRIRMAHLHYANRWETGSGYETREGDQQLEAEFQLQLSF